MTSVSFGRVFSSFVSDYNAVGDIVYLIMPGDSSGDPGFPRRRQGTPIPEVTTKTIIGQIFAENCMKIKES